LRAVARDKDKRFRMTRRTVLEAMPQDLARLRSRQ